MNTEELFAIKQKFLSTIPHPKLILKQIKRLDPSFEPSDIALSESSLEPFLEDYIKNELELKLRIANAIGSVELADALITLMNLHNSLISKLAIYADQDAQEDTSILMSEPFAVYEILKELKNSGRIESEIKKYLWQSDNTSLIILKGAVLKARKIKNYG